MLRIFTSILLFDKRSLTISIYPFSTAKYNDVIYNYIRILSNLIILNRIQKYDFEFH